MSNAHTICARIKTGSTALLIIYPDMCKGDQRNCSWLRRRNNFNFMIKASKEKFSGFLTNKLIVFIQNIRLLSKTQLFFTNSMQSKESLHLKRILSRKWIEV